MDYSKKNKHYLILLFIFTSFIQYFGCAKNQKAENDSIYSQVRLLLSKKKCSKALDVLKSAKDIDEDAIYFMLKASAQSCKGEYSELDLIDGLSSLNAETILGSLASFKTSYVTEADDDSYSYLQLAITTLLESSGDDEAPSAAERLDKFGKLQGNNLNSQLLYMLMAQLGKFIYHYGDTNASGRKSGGNRNNNNCFFTYTDASTLVYLATLPAATSICKATIVGSPDLVAATVTAADKRRRMCEGVILFNNFDDVIANLEIAGNDSLGGLGDVGALRTAAQTLATTAGLTDLEDILAFTAQADCEAYVADNGYAGIQQYFAIIFETLTEPQ